MYLAKGGQQYLAFPFRKVSLDYLLITSKAQSYKTFYGQNLIMFVISYSVVVFGRPFQPSIIFCWQYQETCLE